MTETTTAAPTVTLNNGSTIPQLGFGVFQVPPEDTADVVAKALDVGYRHIDTAALLRQRGGRRPGGPRLRAAREEVFVTTKLGNDDQGAESGLRGVRDQPRASWAWTTSTSTSSTGRCRPGTSTSRPGR